MQETARERLWHLVAVVLGLVATVGIICRPVAAGPARVGTELRITAAPTGELDVVPRDVVAERLAPGGTAVGHTVLRNQTGAGLSVTARVASSQVGLDDRLHVRVRAGTETVADGIVSVLAEGSRPWVLPSGTAVELVVEAWTVPTARGQVDSMHLDVRFDTQPVSG